MFSVHVVALTLVAVIGHATSAAVIVTSKVTPTPSYTPSTELTTTTV
jgi:hypothetical protein